jgi:hypothetical protein
MFSTLDCRGMIAVFPIGSLSLFPLVAFLAARSGHDLHGIGGHLASFPIIEQQIDVIRS